MGILTSGNDGAPGDATNRTVQFDSTGCAGTYDTDHGWSTEATYTLTLNAGPRAWAGQDQRYLQPSLCQTDGTVLWSTNFPVPLYTSAFSAADPWPEALTFSFTIDPNTFTAGEEGANLRLRIVSSGQRGILFDNIRLTGIIPPPVGSVLIVR